MLIAVRPVALLAALLVVAPPVYAQSNLRPQPNERVAPGTVEYRLSGTARSCSATYRTGNGTGQAEVRVPNRMTFLARPGQFLYMSCQIREGRDGGTLTVEIFTDGFLLASDTAVGFPHIATASGTYEPPPQ